MSHTFAGQLFGVLCADCSEAVANTIIRLYRSGRPSAESDSDGGVGILTDDAIQARSGELLAEVESDEHGAFSVELDEERYHGEPLEIHAYCTTVPRRKATARAPRPLQFSIAQLEPSWRAGGEGQVAEWRHFLPAADWCAIRRRFGAWTICGRLLTREQGAPITGASVRGFDADLIEDDPLGQGTSDAAGSFRIDYSTEDFERTPFSPLLNLELVGGPDLYFVAELEGSPILKEDRSYGRSARRKNADACFCVELRAELPPVSEPPVITVDSPASDLVTNQPTQRIAGRLSEPAELAINGEPTSVAPDNSFEHLVSLEEGLNELELIATDATGETGRFVLTLTLDTVAPQPVDRTRVSVGAVANGEVTLTGAEGSVEPDGQVNVTNVRSGETVVVPSGSGGVFSARLAAQAGDVLRLRVADKAGNASPAIEVEVGDDTPALPPDPSTVAPPLDPTVATDLGSATAFLYTGDDPIQKGVAPGTIEPLRAAVLRGRVTDRDGGPLAGVSITVLGHPEYGDTLSRADGLFDLAVNGGGLLVVRYLKERYLPAQRRLQAPWQDYTQLPVVALVPADEKVTTVDLTAPDVQLAQGNPVTDARGTRQATVLVPPGSGAATTLPDGSTEPLSALRLRATEYTVGKGGPEAMPAELPANSGYTYAVELENVDDGVRAAGATEVRFETPVSFYLENYLGFRPGTAVPTGYYDRVRGEWIASDNGLVVEVVGETNGRADLDLNGDGAADEADALAALGITDAERERLAELYEPGQSLWRVPITHFSAVDCNWPYELPEDAEAPDPSRLDGPDVDDPCQQPGSTIDCQNQTLGEQVDLVGTPFALHYKSDRVPGRKAAYTVEIPLSGAGLPQSLIRIVVEITVAGRRFTETFRPLPNQTHSFTWDGQDAYGRTLQGAQPMTVRLSYVYLAIYGGPGAFSRSFARFSGGGTAAALEPVLLEISLTSESRGRIGPWLTPRSQGLGGWSLDVHHAYDPIGRMLHLGDGGRRSAAATGGVITTVATGGLPRRVAVGPDGNVFIGESGLGHIRQVRPDGTSEIVAGGGTADSDGIPATGARLLGAEGMAIGPEGSLFIAETAAVGGSRVRRVGLDGIIGTVAGGGNDSADEIQATAAKLNGAMAVALGPDGSLYIAERGFGRGRIRRVGPDGLITTEAGSLTGFGVDGGPASEALLRGPFGVAVAPDGSLYIADTDDHRVRRVSTDGIIETVAGITTIIAGVVSGVAGFGPNDDGGEANKAALNRPFDVAVGLDGSIYIADTGNSRIRRVGTDGIITTVAGGGLEDVRGEGGPATAAELKVVTGVAVGPDADLVLADQGDNSIRRVSSNLAGFSGTDIAVASADGRQLYRFDANGRHQQTLDALTGAPVYQFGYRADGRLDTIEDGEGEGNVTAIERDLEGAPTAIVGPFEQRTEFDLDDDGYLATLTNPAGESIGLGYLPGGLLADLTVAGAKTHRFEYDDLGRLELDEDSVGGSSRLARIDAPTGFKVTLLSALLREDSYQVERLPAGAQRRVNSCCGGRQTVEQIGTDGVATITSPDGTVTRLETGPDPRFGMQAPVATAITVATPGGRTARVTTEIKAALGTPDDPLSLESLTEVIRINGRPFTTAYDASSKTITATSPLGRVARLRLDDQGGVVETQVGGLLPIEYRYDNRGRLEVATQGGGLEARVIELTYNGSGYVDGFTAPDGRTTRFSYDDAGRLDSYRRHDSSLTVYGYDASGNIEVVRPPARPPHSYNYTPLNQLATSTPPPVGAQPAETTYRYDQDRQLQRVERPNNQIVDLAYDGAGSLVTLNISEGSLQFGIDAGTGHVLTVMAPGGVALSYAYDGPLMTGETWTGPVQGTVARTYDDNLRATSQTVTGGDNIGFKYDEDGLLIGAGELSLIREDKSGLPSGSTLGGTADSWTYSRFGEIDSYSVAHGPAGIYAFTFLRDEVGRITTKTEDLGGTVHTYGYAYDSVGRLEQVQRDGAVIAAYDYDANGNRTTAATPSGTVSAEYDDQDRLEAYGGTVFAYMPGGELRSKTTGGQSTVYDYDVLSNLRAVHLLDGSRVDYLIDGQNRRVGKRINNTLLQGFLYEGDRLVAELAPGGSIVSRFIYGVRQVPEYMIKNGARFRVVSDHLGSPRLVVNADTGQVVQRITYSEFGEVLEDTNPGFQPFGFAGGLYDRHTGLVRFGARDYDAVTGRWTSKDPIGFNGGDTNLYAYALNDPINFLDPDGLDVWDAFGDWVWRSGAAEWDLTQEANFLAGFADVLTLGGTKALRDLQDFYGDPARPLSEIISRCSSSYAAGKYVGAVFGLIINSAGAVRAHARIKDLAREARRWRGAMRAATRRGPSQPAVKVMRPGQAPRKGGPRSGDPGRFDDLPIRRW